MSFMVQVDPGAEIKQTNEQTNNTKTIFGWNPQLIIFSLVTVMSLENVDHCLANKLNKQKHHFIKMQTNYFTDCDVLMHVTPGSGKTTLACNEHLITFMTVRFLM